MSSKNRAYSEKLKKIANHIVKNIPKNNWKLKSKYIKPHLSLIFKETFLLPENTKFSERVFCIINNIFEKPKCKNCLNKDVTFSNHIKGYRLFCSDKCANKSKSKIKQYKQIMNNKSEKELKNISKRKSKSHLNRSKKEIESSNKKRKETLNKIQPKERKKTFKKISNAWQKKSKKEINNIVLKRRNTRIKRNILLSDNFKNDYSKISQVLCWSIYKQLSNELQEKTYFGELNKEFCKRNKNNGYKYDFVISSLKICIEYNGEAFHPNPIWSKEKWDSWICLYSKQTADEKYKYDQTKLNVLRNQGFRVLEVWDSEYIKNPDKVLKQCLDFIFKS